MTRAHGGAIGQTFDREMFTEPLASPRQDRRKTAARAVGLE
jgi:hypothetical protein